MDSSARPNKNHRQQRPENRRGGPPKRRQQAMQPKSFNSLGPSPWSHHRTPKHKAQRSSETFAYDGPQSLELGNPDLLDSPNDVLRATGDTSGTGLSKGTPVTSSENRKSHQSIHIPTLRPMKLPLPKSPLDETDQRSLFDSIENDDLEVHEVGDEEASRGGHLPPRPKTERHKIRTGLPQRRARPPQPPQRRPQSATDPPQRPRVKTNNLIDFDDGVEEDSEKGRVGLVAPGNTSNRSLTPSTTSGVSMPWEESVQSGPMESTITRIFSAGDDVEDFIASPAPKGITVRCRISRDKRGLEGGLFPSYFLHLERQEDGRRFFLLAARRKRRTATCHYLITLDASSTSSPFDAASGGRLCMGNLRSNFLGTQFNLLTSRHRFGSLSDTSSAASNQKDCDPATGEVSKEIAKILYEPNILGFRGPRKMTVLLPPVMDSSKMKPLKGSSKSLNESPGMSTDSSSKVIELHNKKPAWNEETQSYVLNFHGRVTQASVKNFQLIDENDDSTILMQFGRVASDAFTMDYTYPLTALQAFGIAISSLTGKLACE